MDLKSDSIVQNSYIIDQTSYWLQYSVETFERCVGTIALAPQRSNSNSATQHLTGILPLTEYIAVFFFRVQKTIESWYIQWTRGYPPKKCCNFFVFKSCAFRFSGFVCLCPIRWFPESFAHECVSVYGFWTSTVRLFYRTAGWYQMRAITWRY